METRLSSDQTAGFTLWQRIQIGLISWFGWLLIWLICSTIDFRVEDARKLTDLRKKKQPVILCFWHNQIFFQTYLFRFQKIVVMTSRHLDGEYIGRIIGKFGYGTARGSSGRGAARALLELKKHLVRGRDVAFTVDGPRGPAYQAKPGPVFLARKSGAVIVPMHCEPISFWEVNSWDRFRIPRPFTTAFLKFGEPQWVEQGASDEQSRSLLQQELDRLRQYCQSFRLGRQY